MRARLIERLVRLWRAVADTWENIEPEVLEICTIACIICTILLLGWIVEILFAPF